MREIDRRIDGKIDGKTEGKIDESSAQAIAAALTPWFLAHQRDLEWRRTRDPYAIWVSEIMLQQTRVDTVRAYYRPFLDRFPDVHALATADLDQVLAAWSGLGYYRRARLLHRGARHVVDSCGGDLPTAATDLRAIPGIGRYTAGAIASIAYDQPEPLVDGNVARVLSRLAAITCTKDQAADAPGHWERARAILRAGSPRILAQALMELGATVCTPQNPRCDTCPLVDRCAARAAGLQGSIPAPKVRRAPIASDLWALALLRRGRLLLERRPDEGLLAGLWCLPLLPRSEAAENAAEVEPPEKLPRPAAIRRSTGITVRRVTAASDPPIPIRHIFSHRVWILWTCRAQVVGGVAGGVVGEVAEESEPGLQWIAPGERPPGGVPRVTEKLLHHLGY